jgi:hypothetical protein
MIKLNKTCKNIYEDMICNEISKGYTKYDIFKSNLFTNQLF